MIFRTMDKKIVKITEHPIEHADIVESLKVINVIGHPSVMFRKEIWSGAGGYKGDGRCEDYILWTDAIVMGYKVHTLEEPLTIYGLSHRDDQKYHQWVQSKIPEIIEQFVSRLESREKMYSSPLNLIPLSGDLNV